MTLIRFEPLKELETLHDRMQKYFDGFPGFGSDFSSTFSPKIDISDDEKNVYVEAELPGLKKEDIKITLQDNILTLKGEKNKVEEKKEKNYYRSERSYGSFQRSFTLPVEVDSEKVNAKYENGTLILTLEKLLATHSKVKEISLK